MDYTTTIRPQCLRPAADGWLQPTGPEIREAIRRAEMTGSQVAALLGLSDNGGNRQVRRWISEDSKIPYSAWAILCHAAGLGIIWAYES